MTRGRSPSDLFAFQAPAQLWEDGLQAFNLIVNQRQRGDLTWVNDLNALRTCCVREDVERALERLKGRLDVSVSHAGRADAAPDVSADPWSDAVHIFPLTNSAHAHNERRLQMLASSGARVFNVSATHAELLPNGVVSSRPVPANLLPRSADECGGLEAYVALAVGARVMLRRNIDTADNLVNGAMGRVIAFELRGEGPEAVVVAVSVWFDNPDVGRLWRESQGIVDEHAPVAISRTSSAFTVQSGRMLQRTQFALSLAWAVTVHKTQGLSMDRAVLDLGHTLFAAGQAYVALSRVRTREGVALVALASREQVCKVNQDVLAYYQSLGFVPAECDACEEEPHEEEREQATMRERVRERERARDGSHFGQQQQQQQQQQHRQQQQQQQQQQQNAAGERATRGVAEVAALAQQVVGARVGRGRGRGSRRASSARGRGRRGRGPASVAAAVSGLGELLQPPGRRPARPRPLPLRVRHPSAARTVSWAQFMQQSSTWPPPPHMLASLGPQGHVNHNTFSWLYVPVIAHALGHGHLYPLLPSHDPMVAAWVAALQTTFAANGVDWAWATQHSADSTYVDADTQEWLLELPGLQVVAQQMVLYGVQQAQHAAFQLGAAAPSPLRNVRPRVQGATAGLPPGDPPFDHPGVGGLTAAEALLLQCPRHMFDESPAGYD